MTEQEREELLTLKLIVPEIQKAMGKILENQEVVTELRLEADNNKTFRKAFEDKVLDLVSRRLNTIQFEADLNVQIRKQVEIYLTSKDARKDFSEAVNELLDDRLEKLQLNMFWRLTAFIGTIVTAVVLILVKGVFNG